MIRDRNRKRARHARAAIAFMLLTFAAAQAALGFGVETRWIELHDPPFGYRRLRLLERLREAPDRPLVLALGSSRTETGFRPDLMRLPGDPLVFNFGLPGAGPLHQWLTLRRLGADRVRPGVVMIEVLSPQLNERRPVEGCFYPDRLTLAEIRELAPACGDASQLYRGWAAARLNPAYEGRFRILSRTVPVWLPIALRNDYLWSGMDLLGACRLPERFDSTEGRVRGLADAKPKNEPTLRDFRVQPMPDHYLRELVAECRRIGARPIIVSMPEGDHYRGWFSPAGLAELDAYLPRVARETGAPLIDARRWMPEDAFWDSHHLLPKGAAEYSRRLAAEVAGILSRDAAE